MNIRIALIMILVIVLLLLPRFFCNTANQPLEEIEQSHEKTKELVHKADSTDKVLDHGIEKEEKIKAPLKKKFKEGITAVRNQYDSLPARNDTIRILVNLLEDADSLSDIDSVLILLNHEKYLNQKVLADSLLVQNVILEASARKENKRAEKLTKMVQRRNFWLAVTSGVAGLLLFKALVN